MPYVTALTYGEVVRAVSKGSKNVESLPTIFAGYSNGEIVLWNVPKTQTPPKQIDARLT
jgi:hypothetical protein